MRHRILGGGAALAAAAVMVLGMPLTAYAGGGIVRDDDGTKETVLDLDFVDDSATKRLVLPSGIMSGATSATLSVYAQADGPSCGLSGPSQELSINNGAAYVDFNPCDVFSSATSTWASFSVPVSALTDGATNTFSIYEIAGDWGDRNAYYGVDQSHDYGRSDIFQSSSYFTGDIAGELMWYLTVVAPSTSPGMAVTPSSIAFGSVSVGSSSSASTVTVTSTGTANLTVSGVTLGGANPGDFVKSSDGCTGASLLPGTSCTFQVRFSPTTPGARSATATVSSNAGSQSVALSGTGVGDTTPPVSHFVTANASIITSGGAFNGYSTDNASAIVQERLTFTPVTTLLSPTTVTATLYGCSGTTCSWTAAAPLVPGVYVVNAQATDAAGNVEPAPGPAITIIVI